MKKPAHKKISFDEAIAASQIDEIRSIGKPINPWAFWAVLAAVLAISGIFAGKVIAMTTLNSNFYRTRALANVNKETHIIAPRGLILDRFGKPMVENKTVFSVFLNVSEMIRSGEESSVKKAVAEIIGGDPAELSDELREANLGKIYSIKIAEDITRSQTVRLEDLNLQSVSVQTDFKREYLSMAASHLTGYVGLPRKDDLTRNSDISLIDTIGRAGLEAHYDNTLRGVNGKKITYRNAILEAKDFSQASDPQMGQSLTTTIDLEFQEYFYGRMLASMAPKGQKAGVGIAIDPRNGEVLSMISMPAFNANKVGSYLHLPNQPLFNRAISGMYNPGSTIKPFHAVAALKEGVIDETTQIFSRGYIEVPNPYNPDAPSRFVDWKPHGWVDVRSALARSSNVFFYAVGGGLPPNEAETARGSYDTSGLGVARLGEYWRRFNFGVKTGIDIGGESFGFLPNPDEKEKRSSTPWRIGDTYNISIGQGDVLLTPLQLLNAIVALANHGQAYVPHLNIDLPAQILFDASDLASEMTEVEKGMEDAVYKDYGTAHSLASLPFHIAMKTGSAQVSLNTKTNALVVGYGPVGENVTPEIAILVLVEDAKEGSLNALPIANDVFDWYYRNRIAPSSTAAN